MANLQFVDTHNMVAFLSKPTESDGFEQIVDFLNARPIRYALTVNPTIYISCIEQFWSTAMAKTINNEAQLHAKVYGKKIIVTESFVRRDLRLANEEGIDYLLNSTIFEQIALMCPKNTGWNEFSSTMASVIICLATNQKFNFSNFIFYSMIRNLDNVSGKFLMYPRVGKVFFGKVTPLFQTMVQQLGEGSAILTDPQYTPTIIQLSSSQPQKTQNPRKPTRKDSQVPQPSGPTKSVAEKAIHKELGDRLVRAATTASSLEAEQDSGGGLRCQETMRDTISQTRVLDLEKTKTTRYNEIASLKRRVKKLERKNRSRTYRLKRLYKVGLTVRVELSDNEESLGDDASKQERRIDVIDADEGITLVSIQDDVDKEMFDVDALNGEEVFIAGKNENFVEEIVDAAQVSTAAITVTITTKEITLVKALEALKTSIPKQKVEDNKEKDEPKQLMETIPDEKEVAIDAIPLAVKSPRIIDCKIRKEGKKSYDQIVRANGNSDVHNL
uniref:Xylulose kinase-1 n=1 Tax=Tanacetum cinerariifolium TaxID=118510 RepID=A0A699HXL3_TANCI|nr:hypothetical protein [Tanacetum cinerariifolium]